MFDRTSFSLGAFDQNAWHLSDLSHHQRVYATTGVDSLHVQTVADQTIYVAAQNNLSVLGARFISTFQPTALFVQHKPRRDAPSAS